MVAFVVCTQRLDGWEETPVVWQWAVGAGAYERAHFAADTIVYLRKERICVMFLPQMFNDSDR